MKSYKDLDVYQLAHDLAVKTHRMTLELLPKFEMYEEGGQIRRSSKAISSNIVEGFRRKQYQQEYIRFLTYALASCDETKEHLELLWDTASLKDSTLRDFLLEGYENLGKKLFRLRETIDISLNKSILS